MLGSWGRVVSVLAAIVAGAAITACSGGDGTSADAQVAGARVSRISPPTAPRGLQIVMVDGACVVSWRRPVDDGGAPVTGYVVTSESSVETTAGTGPEIGTAAAAVRTLAPTASIVRTTVPQTVRVRARNAAGDGPAGDPATC